MQLTVLLHRRDVDHALVMVFRDARYIDHTLFRPTLTNLCALIPNFGTRRQTRAAGLQVRELAIRRVGLETLMFPSSSP